MAVYQSATQAISREGRSGSHVMAEILNNMGCLQYHMGSMMAEAGDINAAQVIKKQTLVLDFYQQSFLDP